MTYTPEQIAQMHAIAALEAAIEEARATIRRCNRELVAKRRTFLEGIAAAKEAQPTPPAGGA